MRISIAIPTYNFGSFIAETLSSVLTQSPSEDFEVVVVDGASTDNTAEVVKSFSRKHRNLRYINLGKKGGIDADIAQAVELSTGEYCWLFSADDIMRPGAIERALFWTKQGHELYLCEHTNCRVDMSQPQPYPIFSRPGIRRVRLSDPDQRLSWLREARNTEALFSFMSGLLIHREWFRSTPPVDRFMGSCWGHAARILSLLPTDFTTCFVDEVWLDKRGENDSFMDRGLVNRLSIAVEGYSEIAATFFGKESEEYKETLRLLRNEQTVLSYLAAKRITHKNPTQESEEKLLHLFDTLYHQPDLQLQLKRLLFQRCPDLTSLALLKGYGIVGSAWRRIRHLHNR